MLMTTSTFQGSVPSGSNVSVIETCSPQGIGGDDVEATIVVTGAFRRLGADERPRVADATSDAAVHTSLRAHPERPADTAGSVNASAGVRPGCGGLGLAAATRRGADDQDRPGCERGPSSSTRRLRPEAHEIPHQPLPCNGRSTRAAALKSPRPPAPRATKTGHECRCAQYPAAWPPDDRVDQRR